MGGGEIGQSRGRLKKTFREYPNPSKFGENKVSSASDSKAKIKKNYNFSTYFNIKHVKNTFMWNVLYTDKGVF